MKEKERLENLRIQREQREKREAAQERREEGEWSGRYEDMDDEGLRANALLNYLDTYESVEVMTSEDRAAITRLELEIDRLDQEYDNSEDPEPDLLDQKSELEDELEELRNKIEIQMLSALVHLNPWRAICTDFTTKKAPPMHLDTGQPKLSCIALPIFDGESTIETPAAFIAANLAAAVPLPPLTMAPA